MTKKNTTTQLIRDAIARNPNMPAKDIAKLAGTTASYVYSVRYNDLKAYAKKNKAAIARHVYPNDPVYEDSNLHLSNGVVEQAAKALGPNPPVQPFDKPKNPIKPKQRMLTSMIEMIEPEADPVNHPPHYKAGGIETIDFIEAKKLNYNLGNVVKYITRADLKGNRKQDLAKALWYLNRELSGA